MLAAVVEIALFCPAEIFEPELCSLQWAGKILILVENMFIMVNYSFEDIFSLISKRVAQSTRKNWKNVKSASVDAFKGLQKFKTL